MDHAAIVSCFKEYMQFSGHNVTQKLFLANMEAKLKNREFCGDMVALLPHGVEMFSPMAAYQKVKENLIDKL